MLSLDDFKNVVKHTPLIALDLVIRNNEDKILVGLRNNEPAKSYYFVPGGRILKNETFNDALKRISASEIGISLSQKDIKVMGIYEHIYNENYFCDKTFGTHCIVITCVYKDNDNEVVVNNDQHKAYQYLDAKTILESTDVHEYTKSYFIQSPDNCFFRIN